MRLWIGLALIAFCAKINLAQSDEYDWYELDDNSQSQEYEDQVSAENIDDNLDVVKEQPDDGNKNADKVNENIENFYKSLENLEDKSDDSVLNDYQFEDNRSEPKDEQKHVVDTADESEKLSENKLGSQDNSEIDNLDEEINFNYNNSPDSKQLDDDDNIYDMDENSLAEALDEKNQNTLLKDVPGVEENNSNLLFDLADDVLDKVFDDAENVEETKKNTESVEQTKQFLKDLADGIVSSEKIIEDNAEDEKSEEIETKATTKHKVKPMNSIEDFDEFQKTINEDIDSEKNNENVVESRENGDYQPAYEDELDTKEISEEEEQSISQRDGQPQDTNNEENIVEENINNESESNKDENKELSNDFNQYVDEKQTPNKHLVAAEADDENAGEEDTVDKAYADLDDDLKKLFEIWDKLQEDDSDDSLEYEENDDNVDDNVDEDLENFNEEGEEMENDDKIDKETNNDEDNVVLPHLLVPEKTTEKEILDEESIKNVSSATQKGFVDNDEAFYRNVSSIVLDEFDIKNEDESNEENNDNDDGNANPEKTSNQEDLDDPFYRNGFSTTQVSEDTEKSEVLAKKNETESTNEALKDYFKDVRTVKTIDVNDLSPSQYDDLMKQFSVVHSDDLEIKSGDHVAPIHMSLSADEAVVIESPDYPDNYPTNNVIDYYFDGLGNGIEFNITDFSVNGVVGDYLLVKPGGIDASGNEGLVFSYHLNEERRYRFLNVDRLFVRFFAHPGIAMFKGYQFSVKMISPPEEDEELQPEPEPLLPPPATYTVTLGGTSLDEFANIEENFRLLIADMATMYINANNIDSGLNSTSETAQITQTALCNVNWPGFESCVAVTFGVPLHYDDDQPTRLNEMDLQTMWNNYASQDPFAARLRRMGITEFDSPNDRRVLTVWLVIAAGVVISVVMLAFALWRFSCFEDYTRMPAYSDTDSINGKRVLDMYPTPHQTFPALYSEPQLKWDDEKFDDTTRVDMGGYANISYVKDDAVDIDSDEDAITTARDRNSISPRDIYQV